MNSKSAICAAGARAEIPGGGNALASCLVRVQPSRDIVMGLVAKETGLEEAGQFSDDLLWGRGDHATTYPPAPWP